MKKLRGLIGESYDDDADCSTLYCAMKNGMNVFISINEIHTV